MKSCILKGIDDAQRKHLSDNGVIFYDWNKDIVIDESQIALTLELLQAKGEEGNTDYENMVELILTYDNTTGATKKQKKAAARAVQQSRAETQAAVADDPAREKARSAFISASKGNIKDHIEATNAALTEQKKELAKLGANFINRARQRFVAENPLSDAHCASSLKAQYQTLKEIPKVTAVRVVPGSILVYTDDLTATCPQTNELRQIGKFLIVINTAGTNPPVRWYNQTRCLNAILPGMHAPYVLQDGSPLSDSILETLIQLIAQFEFAIVAELAIQFIETVNDDEPGKHISRWPAAWPRN